MTARFCDCGRPRTRPRVSLTRSPVVAELMQRLDIIGELKVAAAGTTPPDLPALRSLTAEAAQVRAQLTRESHRN